MLQLQCFAESIITRISQLSDLPFSGMIHRKARRSRRRLNNSTTAAKSSEVLEERFLLAGVSGVDNTLASSTDLENLRGDFNGDGNEDVANWTSTGEWQIGISDGQGSFDFSRWTRWRTNDVKEIHVGDFDADGKDDIIALFKKGERGDWWMASSTGTSFVTTNWGAYKHYSGIKDVQVGDFDGINGDDLAVMGSTGSWWNALSASDKFVNRKWSDWDTDRGVQQIQVGDFDGDGKDDIAGLFGKRAKKDWVVGLSNGSKFEEQKWTSWKVTKSLDNVMVGDFNNDGKDDIAGLFTGANWWVGLSGNNSFNNEQWAKWSFASSGLTNLEVTDVDGDGDDDIVGEDSSGHRWVGKSTGADFSLEYESVRDVDAGLVELRADGTLRIDGTDLANNVVTEVVDDLLVARLDGRDATDTRDDIFARFDISTVSRILFTGGNGDDRFENRSRISSEAHGGNGDDVLIGGDGDDSLFGDDGNDEVRGHGGNDRIRGGAGRDRVSGDQGDDFLEDDADDVIEDNRIGDRGHDGNSGTDNSVADNNGTDNNGTDHNGTDHNGTDHNGTDHNGNDHDGNDHDRNDHGRNDRD